MPVIAMEGQTPPIVPPPQAEFVVQTREPLAKRPGGRRGAKVPWAGRLSLAAFTSRSSPLVIAGAIGGAAVFVLVLCAILVLLVAASRTAKPPAKIDSAPVAGQQANPIVSDANPGIAVVAPPAQADANPASQAPAPAEAGSSPAVAASNATPQPLPVELPAADPKTEADNAPAAVVVAAVPAKPPASASLPVKKTSGDPFKGFPKSISLPPLPEADSPTAALKPVSLGRCDLDGDSPIGIVLLGGDTAIRATRQRFELVPREMSPREWDIQLTGTGETAAVAALSVKNGELLFQWTEVAAAQALVVRHLMNCALTLGNSKQTLAFRMPQKAQPLVIDIEKPSASVKWTVNNLPLAKQIFLEVTRTEGFPKLRQDPKGATNVGDTVTIGTGPAEKSIPLFLKLNTASAAAAIDVRSQFAVKVESSGDARPYRRKDLTAAQLQYQQELGRLRSELRKAKDSRPRADAEREAREATITRLANEETALNTTLDQLRFILEFAGSTEGAAKIHFRVYFLAGDAKIELLKTDDEEDVK
jgi:hypothetical protein